MTLKDILARVGHIRNSSNLSGRELSYRLGKSHQFITFIENGKTRLNIETLLDILEICNCPLEKFFYNNFEDYEKDKELNTLIKSIPSDKKEHIIELLKK